MNFMATRVHHAKKQGRHHLNIFMTRRPENVDEFIRVLEESLPSPANTSAAQRWEYLSNTICNAASLTLAKSKQRQRIGLRPVHLDEIQPFTDEKRRALASYKSSPCENILHMLRAAQNSKKNLKTLCK